MVVRWLLGCWAGLLTLPVALANSSINMPVGVTPVSRKIYELHMTIFWVCVAIGVIVFGAMIYSIINHRKSKGAVAAQFHEHTSLEILWAVIPFVILVIMAVPATKTLMAMYDTAAPAVTIKITGYQWKWHYQYLDEGLSFFSNLSTPPDQIHNKQAKGEHYLLEVDNPVVVPINKKVRVLVTSADVIHSWWMPAFGVKRDAVPGFIYEAWFKVETPGTYRGQCAELCGVNHGFMPIVVNAVSESEYLQWVQKQKAAVLAQSAASAKQYTIKELMQQGHEVYEKTCAACHKQDGTGMPPAILPLKGSSVATGQPISRHINVVLKGRPGTAMQAFGPQLSDADLAAVITYERNAWGNNTGDVVQPADVIKERAKG